MSGYGYYKHDPVLGRDQRVYIIDKGFNIRHSEFQSGGRTYATYVVPNQIALARMPNKESLPEPSDLTDHCGHGTMVASVAIGRTHGVASNANFVLIKNQQATAISVPNPDVPNTYLLKHVPVSVEALRDAWQFVVKDVLRRRGNGETGKSIVSMSAGTMLMYASVQLKALANTSQGYTYLPGWGGANPPNYVELMFEEVLDDCWRNDIITVISAGNFGHVPGMSLEKITPQNLGTPDNGLITVGGVTATGALWTQSSVDAGKGGSVTVYAVAEKVTGADYQGNDPAIDDGTSLAAPAVAGLAAYFASVDSLRGEWRPGNVARDMKRYIETHAVERQNPPFNVNNLPWTYFTDPPLLIGPVKVRI